MLVHVLNDELTAVRNYLQQWVDEAFVSTKRDDNIEELFQAYKRYKDVIDAIIAAPENVDELKSELVAARRAIADTQIAQVCVEGQSVMPENHGGSVLIAQLCSEDLFESGLARFELLSPDTATDVALSTAPVPVVVSAADDSRVVSPSGSSDSPTPEAEENAALRTTVEARTGVAGLILLGFVRVEPSSEVRVAAVSGPQNGGVS